MKFKKRNSAKGNNVCVSKWTCNPVWEAWDGFTCFKIGGAMTRTIQCKGNTEINRNRLAALRSRFCVFWIVTLRPDSCWIPLLTVSRAPQSINQNVTADGSLTHRSLATCGGARPPNEFSEWTKSIQSISLYSLSTCILLITVLIVAMGNKGLLVCLFGRRCCLCLFLFFCLNKKVLVGIPHPGAPLWFHVWHSL